MLKALCRSTVFGAAMLAVTTPASAAATCQTGSVEAYGSPGSFAAAGINAYDFCTGDYLSIVEVGNWPSFYVYGLGNSEVTVDGIYYSQETVTVTVVDQDNVRTTFAVTIYPNFS